MITLDKVVNDSIKIIEKKVDEKLKNQTSSKTKFWRGKKLVSINKWQIMARKKHAQYELLDFMPDDYIEAGVFYPVNDDKLRELRAKWYDDYDDFLEFKKNPGYGEYKCRRCILHPKSVSFSASLENVIPKGIDIIKPDAKFPCNVVNLFSCPYGLNEKNSDRSLFNLKTIWKLIDDVILHFYSYSGEITTYEVDFQTDNVKIYYDRCFSGPNSYGTINNTLGALDTSKIRIITIKDIYDLLTNKQTFSKAIDRYVINMKKWTNDEVRAEAKLLKNIKDFIINYLEQIKERIKIEDLHDYSGRDLEGERKEEERRKEIEKWLCENSDSYDPKRIRYGECTHCEDFSNICCINCDIWICVEHWRQHQLDVHNIQKNCNY